MTIKTLYESEHPRIVITHDTDTDEIILNRADKYMRNPESTAPPFITQCVVLMNIGDK